MNVQILVLPGGRLVWASDPYLGSVHDVAALAPSGLLEGIDPSGWIVDKGYVGRGMITPHKKPPNGELSEAAKEANRSVNKIRQVVERTIAHIKSWRIHPHRLPAPPAHIRADHHRRTLTPRLQNYPLNKLPCTWETASSRYFVVDGHGAGVLKIRASHVFAAGPPGVVAGRAYFVTTSGATAWTKGATGPGFSAAIRPRGRSHRYHFVDPRPHTAVFSEPFSPGRPPDCPGSA